MAKRLAILVVPFVFATNVYASGTFIPAPNRIDTVYDFGRNRLYISNGAQVLRYDIQSDVFLDPLTLGGSLRGMDLSADGNTLVVTDLQYSATQNWVYLVDLETDTWRQATFDLAFGEGGTFAAAFGEDGRILVTSSFQGSGFVPLRRYDPVTDTYVVVLSSITQNTMVIGSGDGVVVGFAESNISDGRWGVYYVDREDIVERTGYTDGTSWFNFEIGVNHDGTQCAIPTYGGTFFYNAAYEKIATIGIYAGPQPIGVAYHPVEDRAYFSWADTTEVREYDTSSFMPLATYDFENSFTHTGNAAFVQGRMKISPDGSLLFATVDGGVRYVRLYDSLAAYDKTVMAVQDTATAITLDGSVGNNGALTFTVDTPPAYGTLSGTAPDLVYTPNPSFTGIDAFTYLVSYGRAVARATVSVDVESQSLLERELMR